MVNINFISAEIFISFSIMFLLILGVFKKNSSGLIYNLMGDIYLDLGNRAEAQNYYSLAIANVTENSNLTQLIQIKLDDLN